MTTAPGRAEVDRWLCDAAADLHVYLERRLRAREAADAVLAETMRRAVRHARELSADPGRRRMWLFTVAANVLADQRHATTGRYPSGDGDAVRNALRLHTAQRELLILIEWSGLDVVEAARLLGLSTPTGGGSYAAAGEHLRQSLVRAAAR